MIARPRAFLGLAVDGIITLALRDRDGKPRLMLDSSGSQPLVAGQTLTELSRHLDPPRTGASVDGRVPENFRSAATPKSPNP